MFLLHFLDVSSLGTVFRSSEVIHEDPVVQIEWGGNLQGLLTIIRKSMGSLAWYLEGTPAWVCVQ